MNRRGFLKALAAVPVAAALAPLAAKSWPLRERVARLRLNTTTIDAVLENIYLPRIRESLGRDDVRWMKRDGRILAREDGWYKAALVVGPLDHRGYSYGVLAIKPELLYAQPASKFARGLDLELTGLVRDLKEYLMA